MVPTPNTSFITTFNHMGLTETVLSVEGVQDEWGPATSPSLTGVSGVRLNSSSTPAGGPGGPVPGGTRPRSICRGTLPVSWGTGSDRI